MHLRDPVDLQWVYNMSQLQRRTSIPITVDDVQNNLDDMLRRLRRVEVQMGDIERQSERQRRPKKTARKRQLESQDAQPPAPTTAPRPTAPPSAAAEDTRQTAAGDTVQQAAVPPPAPTDRDTPTTTPSTRRRKTPGPKPAKAVDTQSTTAPPVKRKRVAKAKTPPTTVAPKPADELAGSTTRTPATGVALQQPEDQPLRRSSRPRKPKRR